MQTRAVDPRDARSMEILSYIPWYTNGHCVAVVAVKGEVEDWAAYIGAEDDIYTEKSVIEKVQRWGEKLPEKVASAFFPGVELTYRP